jgi:hypothetical protein
MFLITATFEGVYPNIKPAPPLAPVVLFPIEIYPQALFKLVLKAAIPVLPLALTSKGTIGETVPIPTLPPLL